MGFSLRHLHHFNPWAILVSAVILWVLGAIWYSPALFSKPWMAALNIVPDSSRKGLATGMIASFLGDLLVAFVLLHVILWSGAATGFAAHSSRLSAGLASSPQPSSPRASTSAVPPASSGSTRATGSSASCSAAP